MKFFFRRIHLYMGLAAGLVIMISCFTGAVLVLEEELQQACFKERYFVKAEGNKLPVSDLIQRLKQKAKNIKVIAVRSYTAPDRSVEIAYTIKEKKKEEQRPQKEARPEPGKGNENNRRAFINPYTGEIIELYNYQQSFFYKMFALHRWLLGGATGKLITGVSTLIFVFILITGIILWFPKNKAILKQRLKIKKDAGWKRWNHDWHIVLGFYSSIFLFVFAFTALAWSFEWFNDGIYKLTNSPVKPPKPPQSAFVAETQKASVDEVLLSAMQLKPNAVFYNLNFPKDSAGAYQVTVLPVSAGNESQTDNLFFDQYNAQLLKQQSFNERNLGQRVRATFKPLHVGSIWGMPSKIIAFISCMLGVTFPVTGIIMWLNRIRKKK